MIFQRNAFNNGMNRLSNSHGSKNRPSKDAVPKPLTLRLEKLEERALLNVAPFFTDGFIEQNGLLANESRYVTTAISIPEASISSALNDTYDAHDRETIEALGLTIESEGVVWNSEGRLTELTYSNSTITAIEITNCAALEKLDLSGCKNLARLDCSDNALQILNVTDLECLTELNCSNNEMTFLDLSYKSYLTSLNVSGCVNLTTLRCVKCALTSLDVSGCINLSELRCEENSLSSLDVSNFQNLNYFYCYNNALVFLDVSGCVNLQRLDCYKNMLTTLDVSDCTKLYIFRCNDNLLTSLDVSNCTNLLGLTCNNNSLVSLNVTECAYIQNVLCSNNSLVSLELSDLEYLRDISCNNNLLTTLDVSGCLSLQRLWCYDNSLTSLDVSDKDNLQTLHCYNNSLTSLDVSDCTNLQTLHCYNNSLTSLDMSGCTSLQSIQCEKNTLASLNVSNCENLISISCENNSLTLLDVSDCKKLAVLWCNNNLLTSLDLSDFQELQTLYCQSNLLTNLDVSGCENLNMVYCQNNFLTTLDVSDCNNLQYLYCQSNSLTSLNVSGCANLQYFYCYYNLLSSLDLDNNTNLFSLRCDYNELTSIDLSDCENLHRLICIGNAFTSLDLSNCAKIERLLCYENRLTSIDVSCCENLKEFDCSYNELTSLDVTNCKNLTSLACSNNDLNSLDVSNNANLESLDVGSNISTLDLTKNTKLIALGFDYNLRTIMLNREASVSLCVSKTYNFDDPKYHDFNDLEVVGSSGESVESSEWDYSYLISIVPESLDPITLSYYKDGVFVGTTRINPRIVTVTTLDDVVDSADDVISLREAIANAQVGDIITFAESGNVVLTEGPLDINKQITIDASSIWDIQNNAPGVTISGNNESRVFFVNGENVELIGLTITNGSVLDVADGSALDYYGGGVYNEGVLSVRNVDFLSNKARLGGAIYNRGTISVTGAKNRSCAFTDNEAIGIVVDGNYKYGSGGGLYNSSGNASLKNVSFSENAAYKYGGAISSFAELYLENIVCESNVAGAGGALQNAGLAYVVDFTAKNNQALVRDKAFAGEDFGGNGGAIFHSNKANSEKLSTLELDGSTFEDNHAQNGGGAVDFLSGTVVFNGANGFYANVADVFGGALVVVGEVEIDSATFSFEKENELNTNEAPFGPTIAATYDSDALKEGFFGTSDINSLTNNEPYKLFDTFVRARTITDEQGDLALDFGFFANTSAESVTSVTVLRVDSGEPITVVRGTPAEGETNAVTLGDLGVSESEWNSGDSIDLYYYVNGNADYMFKLTLTRGTNGALMIQRINMVDHAPDGFIGYNFRTFGYEPISKWTLDWGEKDENNQPVKSDYTGLGYLWNAFHMFEDEGVKHMLTLTVTYANDRTDSFVFDCVSPRKNSDAVLDGNDCFEEFFADEDWVEELFLQ